ncbi:hypothetical protein CKO12_02945 [Chromatium okenii]|nr:hypothetical protein [Chromatium okenii]
MIELSVGGNNVVFTDKRQLITDEIFATASLLTQFVIDALPYMSTDISVNLKRLRFIHSIVFIWLSP